MSAAPKEEHSKDWAYSVIVLPPKRQFKDETGEAVVKLWIFKTLFTQVEKCLLFCALTYYFFLLFESSIFIWLYHSLCFLLVFLSYVSTFPKRFDLWGKPQMDNTWTSLHLFCCFTVCASVFELFGCVCTATGTFSFFWMPGDSDSTNHLPAPQLFATILFIYKK